MSGKEEKSVGINFTRIATDVATKSRLSQG